MREFEEARSFLATLDIDVAAGRIHPCGIWYLDVVNGNGVFPERFDNVEVHYRGWLADGTLFDSSHERGEPAVMHLDSVIEGWSMGLSTMRAGGRRVMILPSSLGYGENGVPPVIPPDATLVFDVNLLSVFCEHSAVCS